MEMIRQKLGGTPQITFEVTLLTKDNRKVALEVGTRLLFRQGVPVGVQGIARDITERKRAEALERDRNQVLEQVAGNAPLEEVLSRLCADGGGTASAACSVRFCCTEPETLGAG